MKIPKQIQIPYVGAFLNLIGNVLLFYSIGSFIMVSWMTYNSDPDSWICRIFPAYIYFLMALCLVGILLCLVNYIFFFPSQNKFAQEQAVIEGRSPSYEKICKVETKIDILDCKIRKLEKLIEGLDDKD